MKKKESSKKPLQPHQPGKEFLMSPLPEASRDNYRSSEKLLGKVALITGGDIGIGIGRAVAIMFANEGTKLVTSFLPLKILLI